MNNYTNMTYAQALENGYRDGDLMYFQGYVSRRVNQGEQPVMIAGGTRKGELYVELPNWRSTNFSFRQYLIPVNPPKPALPTKKHLVREIAQELAKGGTVEFEDGKPVYYLHLVLCDSARVYMFVNHCKGADETFTAVREYKCATEKEVNRLYETENLHSPSYREICEELADQVLKYLENHND